MGRVVKKPFERKLEIVEAARLLFQTKKITLQEVMDCLGIAKGTIYHYFRSKEELLEAVVEEIVQKHLEKMEFLIQKMEGNALQKMQAVIESGRSLGAPDLLNELHKKNNEAMHTRLLAATLMKLAPLYGKLIEQGCKEGLFQVESPRECAEFLLSAIEFLTDSGIYPWSKADLHRRMKAFPQLIEQQLRAPRGSFAFLHSAESEPSL